MRKETLILSAAGIGALVAARTLMRGRGDDLRAQVVLITGGSRGLGLALARSFIRQECRIAICARDRDELRAAARDLKDRGGDAFTVECDVTDRAQVSRMVHEVERRYGRIDVLVNNAGEIQVGPVRSMTLQDFDRAMKVMFWGTVYPTLAVLPKLLERNSGRIVNITSIGAKVAVPHLLPYTCAKFAAASFSEGLRAELAGKNVKVVTIAPGLMRTGSHLNASFKGDTERESTWFSLAATLPGISMNADRAAAQIVEATRRGDAEKILSNPANLAARFHGLFPGATAELLGLVNRMILPKGQGSRARRGRDTKALHSPWLSAVTVLGRIAARRYLQHAGERRATARA
jgi:NAD(P)-dependent dehydrogenase (short-subunit alcohol dehydrogenase family)